LSELDNIIVGYMDPSLTVCFVPKADIQGRQINEGLNQN